MRLIASLAAKPTLADNSNSNDSKPQKKKCVTFDPFMPPFEPGLFITELSRTHNLLFNKFMICKMHVLVTTSSMERQDDPLTVEDFYAMLLTMQSLNTFVFFNRGYLSGMSIIHKHF